jgi:integrase/recombinase XerD
LTFHLGFSGIPTSFGGSFLTADATDDMTLRKLKTKTQATFLRAVLRFTRFFGRSPDLASPEDLRRFQLHLVEQDVSSTTINATITGLKFFFGVSLERTSALTGKIPTSNPQQASDNP